MRKLLKLMLASTILLAVFATKKLDAKQIKGDVTFIANTKGWSGEKQLRSETIHFENDEVIGMRNAPLRDGYSIGVQYFLYWATSENVNDPDTKIVFETEKLSTVFPNGIPENAKLYAHYADGFKVLAAVNQQDENNVFINKQISAEATVLNRKILTHVGFDDEKEGHPTKDVMIAYKDDVPFYPIHFQANFSFNKLLSTLIYRNPDRRIAGVNDLNHQTASLTTNDPGYVYVDLEVKFPDEVQVNDEIKVGFKSYNFMPWFVLDENNEKLVVKNSSGEIVSHLGEITSSTSAETSFIIQTNQKKQFTLRTRLRENGNFNRKIQNITTSQLFEEMTITSLSADNFKIEKNVARAMVESKQWLQVTGAIQGATYINHRLFKNSYPIKRTVPLKDVRIGFADVGHVVFKFVDETNQEIQPPKVVLSDLMVGTQYNVTDLIQEQFNIDQHRYVFYSVIKNDATTGIVKKGTKEITLIYKMIAEEKPEIIEENVPSDSEKPPVETPKQPPVDKPEHPKQPQVKPVPPVDNQVIVRKPPVDQNIEKPNIKPNVETNDYSDDAKFLMVISLFFAIIFIKKSKKA